MNGSDCIVRFYFHATLSVQPLTADVDIKYISAFKCARYSDVKNLPFKSFHKAAIGVSASNQDGSLGGGRW